jgi:hypothetical protein
MATRPGLVPEFETWAEYDAWVAARNAARGEFWLHAKNLSVEGMAGHWAGAGENVAPSTLEHVQADFLPIARSKP